MWNNKLWETTRGRIVSLLRRREQTVDELARELGITDNAVRAQLGPLERDGLVRVAGVRKQAGAGKPAVLYDVPPEADALFSRAYAPMFTSLVTTLAERMDGPGLTAVMVNAGQRLADAYPAPTGDRKRRLAAATDVMRQLGADVELVEQDGSVLLRGSACPLGVAVERRHEVCAAMQAFLEAMLGESLTRCCSYEGKPRCCFGMGG
ncbi:MAG TPA: helix-turn-helix domain-containing protein [Gemmatimonadales bacterium]|jgi:predicted ArsR family transcriptional regulator|nr:helix-turn-helix domain-containing protein [Gemmatimonadales bacterium]